MSRFKRRPSPSTVISLIALFVALSSTATAAIVVRSSSQIKNGAVKRADIANDSITSKKIKDGKVKLNDLGRGLQRDLSGGAGGALGGGVVRETIRDQGPNDVAANSGQRVVTMENLAPGSYAFFAKTTLAAQPEGGLLQEGQSAGGRCTLNVQDDPGQNLADTARNFLASPGANTPGTANMQITASFDANARAFVECDVSAVWSAANASIIAVPVRLGPQEVVSG